jgi:hypothetical protein
MSTIAIHQTSRPHELAREINKLTDGIERDSKLAGQYLATLKAGKPLGITWEHYLKDCGVKISARHADRLIEAHQGPTRKSPTKSAPDSDTMSEPDNEIIEETPEASAEAMKATFAELDNDDGDQTKQPPREVAKLIRAWVTASPEAKRQFIRERWDEIARARKQLDANGAAAEDRWIEGESL